MRLATLGLVLALGGWGTGCKTARVNEEDRQVLDLSRQIVEQEAAQIDTLKETLVKFPEALKATEPTLVTLLSLNLDQAANTAQLIENFGAPKAVVPYSSESAKTAREASKKSHSGGTWAWLTGGLVGGLGLAFAAFRTFGRYLPGVGPVFATVDTLITGVEKFMNDKKAKGDVTSMAAVSDLKANLVAVQESSPAIKAFVEKRLEKVQEKMEPLFFTPTATAVTVPKV